MRGVANAVKRRAIFDQHRRNSDMLILQESHSTIENERIWENEWGGKAFFSHGTSSARGISVFVTRSMYNNIKNVECGSDGRYIIMDILENNQCITLITIYAPNEDTPNFFTALSEKLKYRSEHKIIIGDFNLTLDVDLDRLNTYSNNNKARDEVENMMSEYCLKDVWRIRNQDAREYSWRKGGNLQKASRIDLALVSAGLDQKVEYIQYLACIKTDHRAVYMVVNLEYGERGVGYWKFNTALLQDKTFVEQMNEELIRTVELTQHKSAMDRWEDIKVRIKKNTVKYSASKASEDKIIISQLSEIVNEYEASLPLTREDDQKLLETKTDLEEKLLERAKGMIFRSKARWTELGEKSTKYFFGLEKARYNAKTCYCILDENGEEIHQPEKILEKQREFYHELYDIDEDVEFNLMNNTGISVSEENVLQQKEQITSEDLAKAIKAMNNGKTPGQDGIPVDFYKVFWKLLKKPYMDMMIEVYDKEILHTSARKGILNLIPKANKDTRRIKNLRPITLLNTDYKIIEKAVANKMIPALEEIIHTDQRGFMQNRRISVNIRKMLDIIHEAEKEDLEAVVLSLDFVKCFDKCSFSILHGSLDFFGFGEIIRKWTEILYRKFTVRIQNNGNFSYPIQIKKGVHQGGCCSSIYFLVIAEILAISLRTNQDITGITIADIRNILNQFADDMDIFSMAQEQSLRAIHKELDDFRYQSGFTVSYEKTTLYRIGSLRFSDAQMYNMSEYVWSNRDITVLGVTVTHDELVDKNYQPILQKTRKVLASWENRGLSLIGKIQVVNTLVASLLVYKMMVLPRIPERIVKNMDNIIRDFIWNGKKAKIAYDILQLPKKEGGLGLVDLKKRDTALKATWPLILAQEMDYAQIVYKQLRVTAMGEDIWKCTIWPEDVRKLRVHNEFWKDVLEAWNSFNSYYNVRPENQLLWYNSHIKVAGKIVWWKDVYNRGLKYIHQLFEGHSFKTDHKVWEEFGLTKLRFNSLKLAIPQEWKDFFVTKEKSEYFPLSPHNIQSLSAQSSKGVSSRIYKYISGDAIRLHGKYLKWIQEEGSDFIDTLCDFKEEHQKIFVTTNIVKFRSFQYRVLQRAIVTNIQLYKWGIKATDLCYFCLEERETVTHLLCKCPIIVQLWEQVASFIQQTYQVPVNLSSSAIIFNKIVTNRKHVANFLGLITKQYVYSQKCLGKSVNFPELKARFKHYEVVEKYIATKNDNLERHNRKWYKHL